MKDKGISLFGVRYDTALRGNLADSLNFMEIQAQAILMGWEFV